MVCHRRRRGRASVATGRRQGRGNGLKSGTVLGWNVAMLKVACGAQGSREIRLPGIELGVGCPRRRADYRRWSDKAVGCRGIPAKSGIHRLASATEAWAAVALKGIGSKPRKRSISRVGEKGSVNLVGGWEDFAVWRRVGWVRSHGIGWQVGEVHCEVKFPQWRGLWHLCFQTGKGRRRHCIVI